MNSSETIRLPNALSIGGAIDALVGDALALDALDQRAERNRRRAEILVLRHRVDRPLAPLLGQRVAQLRRGEGAGRAEHVEHLALFRLLEHELDHALRQLQDAADLPTASRRRRTSPWRRGSAGRARRAPSPRCCAATAERCASRARGRPGRACPWRSGARRGCRPALRCRSSAASTSAGRDQALRDEDVTDQHARAPKAAEIVRSIVCMRKW